MNTLTAVQQAWLAGLYEGEGTISFGGGRQVIVRIRMTDEDVIRQVHQLVGFGTVTTRDPGDGNKRSWAWSLGTARDAEIFIDQVWPYLFSRRRAQAFRVLQQYREYVGGSSTRGPRAKGSVNVPVDHMKRVRDNGLQVPEICKHGHSMLPDNFVVKNNVVRCRTCEREASRRSQEKFKTSH